VTRNCVILNNGDSLKGIHHVSDAVLFERPLSQSEKANLISKLDDEKKKFKNNEVKMREVYIKYLGYKDDDKVHVKYQLLNGASGFLVYYYSFKPQGLVSLVSPIRK